MPKQKTVNYTDDMVAQMTTIYQAAHTDSARDDAMLELQKLTGKSIPSIRSKLGQLKIYVAKKAAAKKSTGVNKETMVQLIAVKTNKPDGFFTSLESANKTVLQYVADLQDTVQAQQTVIETVNFEEAESAEDFQEAIEALAALESARIESEKAEEPVNATE